jgi:hypothetical protein
VPVAALLVAGGLVAILSGGNSGAPGNHGVQQQARAGQIEIHGSGLATGRTISVPAPPGSISLGTRNLWISLPSRNEIVRANLNTGAQQAFPAAGSPTAIAAGFSALWVAQRGSRVLDQFNGDSGARTHFAKLPGAPVAIALDQPNSSVWVADSSGAISHVVLGGSVVGTPAHSAPPATSITCCEGQVWAANGASNGLLRVGRDTSGSSRAFAAGPSPVAVALDQGVWTANASGHLTRFDPRPDQLRVNADIAVAPELDAVAAIDPGPFVWALSKDTKTLYRISATGKPAVTGSVRFASTPVAVAVNPGSVWVALQDGKVVEILV